MAIPLYLAMTAAEIRSCKALPGSLAWMSCLFSPYGTGLSNLPKHLPAGALLIVSDRTPAHSHDPSLICKMLQEATERFHCRGILLDFQRPGCSDAAAIARELIQLPCPTAVSEPYARELDCPVFLPPVPPDQSVNAYLTPWKGREIWLEAAIQNQIVTVTYSGSRFEDCCETISGPFPHRDPDLHCRYRIETDDDEIRFILRRDAADLTDLLEEAATFGVVLAAGLYQELGKT